MSSLFCDVCGKYKTGGHQCPPAWECWIHEHGEGDRHTTVHAHEAEYAAEEFMQQYETDCAEYPVLQGDDCVVVVQRMGEDERHYFRVSGEYVPTYSAENIDQEEADEEIAR